MSGEGSTVLTNLWFGQQEIGILRQLVSFDVSKNKLEWLPPEIEALHCLSELYLSSNLLLELPDNIGESCNNIVSCVRIILQDLELKMKCRRLRTKT